MCGVLFVLLLNLIGMLFELDELKWIVEVVCVCGGFMIVDEIY